MQDQLVRTVRAAAASDAALDISRYLPQTWLLPDDLVSLEAEWDGVAPLILKHGISARGEGISLTCAISDVRAASAQAEESGKATCCSLTSTARFS